MTSKFITFRNLVAAGMLCFAATSCSDDGDADNRLPDGRYPMTFTATVDGLAATRATTDNNSRWVGGEQISIQVGSKSKTYTAASDGTLTSTDGLYWQNKNSVNVMAWYPTDFSLTNITDQSQSDNYVKLDFLYSLQEEVPFNTTASLNFEHRMAKVTATLKAGSGLEDSDLQGATVKFYGYTNATVNCAAGTITSPNNNGWITACNTGGNSYSALLIPQSPFPAGGKFISVTIGSNIYYYIPQSGDADTEAGKAYNYTITVHKSGILVSADGWQSMGDVTGTNNTNPSYTITVVADNLTDVAITNTTKGTEAQSSIAFQYALNATENPVLTFKTNSGYEVNDVQIEGIVTNSFMFDETSSTYQYTLSNVYSDVWIDVATVSYTQPATPQPGDFLYTDGTFSHETLFHIKTCAGVFYTKNQVVALHNAGRSRSVNAEIIKTGYLENTTYYYLPKVKDKSWHAPSVQECGNFYTAYSSSSSVIGERMKQAGGSVPGAIWTKDAWNINYQYWYNCSNGQSDNTNEATYDIRSFLTY